MYKLWAIIRSDGTGLVKDADEKNYLFKYPYNADSKQFVSNEEIEKNFHQLGFEAIDENFSSFESIGKRLNELIWEQRRAMGDTERYADKETYKRYMESIPAALLPRTIDRLLKYKMEGKYEVVIFMGECIKNNPNYASVTDEKRQFLDDLLLKASTAANTIVTEQTSIFNISLAEVNKAKSFGGLGLQPTSFSHIAA